MFTYVIRRCCVPPFPSPFMGGVTRCRLSTIASFVLAEHVIDGRVRACGGFEQWVEVTDGDCWEIDHVTLFDDHYYIDFVAKVGNKDADHIVYDARKRTEHNRRPECAFDAPCNECILYKWL